MKNSTVKVGTRGSSLALAQTGLVVKQLEQANPGLKCTIVPIRTSGDRITGAAELRRAGKGLFVKEIERALLARKISLAVHSMKDVPSALPDKLTLGAILERVDPSDAFIGRDETPVEKLPANARIGTSSLRRQAILRAMYPHLVPVELRGNLDTRLEALFRPRSNLAGIIVAAAGLQRLRPKRRICVQLLPRDKMVPAAGQGALGIEIRAKDDAVRKLLAPLHHPLTAVCVEAERELLRRMEGGCQVPLGVHAEILEEGLLRLTAVVASVDGTRVVRAVQSGTIDDPRGVAEALEIALRSQGAGEILAALHRDR